MRQIRAARQMFKWKEKTQKKTTKSIRATQISLISIVSWMVFANFVFHWCDAVRCINLMCRHRFWSTLICYWALLERNDSEATMKPELDSGETKKLSPKRVTDVLQSAAPKAQQQNQNAKEIRNTHFLLSFHFKQFSQVCLHLPDRIQMEIEWPLELIKMDRKKESRIIKWASAKLRIGKCIINWFARIHFVLYALSV